MNGGHGSRETDSDEKGTDDGNDPVDLVVCGPAVNHKSNREGESGGDQEEQTVFRALNTVALREPHVDLVTVVTRKQLRSATKTQSHVAKTGDTLAESVGVLEDLRERCEQEVDDTVDQAHVQRHDDTDRTLVQELDRAADDLTEELAQRKRRLVGGLDVGVAGFFAHAGCLSLKEDGSVGFAEENKADNGGDTAQDGQQPEDPSPVCGLGEETTSDGADDGCDKHTQTEDTHDATKRQRYQ